MRAPSTGYGLPVCVGLTSVTLSALYVTGTGGTAFAAVSCWTAIAVFASAMAFFAFKASRLMGRDDPARRFWSAFAVGSAIFSAGSGRRSPSRRPIRRRQRR